MLRQFRASIVILLLMTALLGLGYPLAMVGIAGVAFPDQASGSIVEREGKVVGSHLIGQNFTEDRYFHGRPSATADAPYNAAASGGSNLGPTSDALAERVKEDVQKLGGGTDKPVPTDLATASGSGLDPHISPAAAAWQIPRVAKARNMSAADLQHLVARYTEGRTFGLLGEPRVNVLELNLALDAMAKR